MSKQDRMIARGKEADVTAAEIIAEAIARIREPDPVRVAMLGTEYANDEPSRTFEERRSRCFELACYALAFGDAPHGATLVNGSWQGPTAPVRIPHAWLHLGRGRFVWEPIRHRVYRRAEFDRWTRAEVEVEYTLPEVRRQIAESGHYGPWHRPIVRLEDR